MAKFPVDAPKARVLKTTVLRTMPWVLVVCVVLVVYLLRKPILIEIHKRRMNAAWARAVKGPPSKRQGDYLDRYDASLEALVRLGYFVRKEFRLRHISVPSENSKQFWLLVMKTFPEHIHVNMQGYEPQTPDALVVWDRPERISIWEKFVSTHDVPDFAERFTGVPAAIGTATLPGSAPATSRKVEHR